MLVHGYMSLGYTFTGLLHAIGKWVDKPGGLFVDVKLEYGIEGKAFDPASRCGTYRYMMCCNKSEKEKLGFSKLNTADRTRHTDRYKKRPFK